MRMTIAILMVLAVILSAGSIAIAGARVPTAEEVYGDEAAYVQVVINCSNCTIILPENCNISISGEGTHPCQIRTDEDGKVHIECAAPPNE